MTVVFGKCGRECLSGPGNTSQLSLLMIGNIHRGNGGRGEIVKVYISALSAGGYYATTLLVMCRQTKKGRACTPHPHQAGLALPS
jgi:hypothetical protein